MCGWGSLRLRRLPAPRWASSYVVAFKTSRKPRGRCTLPDRVVRPTASASAETTSVAAMADRDDDYVKWPFIRDPDPDDDPQPVPGVCPTCLAEYPDPHHPWCIAIGDLLT